MPGYPAARTDPYLISFILSYLSLSYLITINQEIICQHIRRVGSRFMPFETRVYRSLDVQNDQGDP